MVDIHRRERVKYTAMMARLQLARDVRTCCVLTPVHHCSNQVVGDKPIHVVSWKYLFCKLLYCTVGWWLRCAVNNIASRLNTCA